MQSTLKLKTMTKKQIMLSFFEAYPEFRAEFRVGKKQNSYSADCRCSFSDHVDYLLKDEQISETQANNTCLGFSTNLFKK